MKIDLAEFFRLKAWSDGQLAFAWAATIVGLIPLLIVNVRMHEPFRIVDTGMLLLGASMFLGTAYQEKRGTYRGSQFENMRVVHRDREPDRFRWNSNMQIILAFILFAVGLFLQVSGWYVVHALAR